MLNIVFKLYIKNNQIKENFSLSLKSTGKILNIKILLRFGQHKIQLEDDFPADKTIFSP